MWKITRDYISSKTGFDSEVGKSTPDFNPDKAICKFRLLDDDGNVYYHGLSDSDNDEKAFEPLDYYQVDSGCTMIEYQNPETKEWERL